MSAAVPDVSLPARGPAWKWWVCGLLLLATMLNYMDRLTLNLTSKQIMDDFGLDERGYGQLESAFAFAFALGAIIVGWMADRWNVRWLYPCMVLAWSAAGFATGLARTFGQLLACRFLLGLFEAGHWPCALRTTQRILPPSERAMGNGLLQSGAALGAVVTPLIVLGLLAWTGDWRPAFLAVGAVGVTWVFLWLPSVRRQDLALAGQPPGPTLASILAWLILLLLLDLAVHVPASEVREYWPALGDAIVSAPSWLPLAVKAAVTVLGIAGVFLWLRRATRDDTTLPRRDFFRRFWVLVVLVSTINITWHYLRAWLPLFLQKQHGYSPTETNWFFLVYYVATDVGTL